MFSMIFPTIVLSFFWHDPHKMETAIFMYIKSIRILLVYIQISVSHLNTLPCNIASHIIIWRRAVSLRSYRLNERCQTPHRVEVSVASHDGHMMANKK